jgi:carbonic anhydrase/acetyltransferase-like protein (isoleucine patch superfamily)
MPVHFLGKTGPTFPSDDRFWIAPGARVIGNIWIGEDVGIWFNAVLRGDNEVISIGRGTNIQDGAILHSDPGAPLSIGEGCTIGHAAVVHGCTIGPNCLIGMGATILNGARIGANSIVGANALITERKEFPDGALIAGVPAKVVRMLDDAAIESIRLSASAYITNYQRFKSELSV